MRNQRYEISQEKKELKRQKIMKDIDQGIPAYRAYGNTKRVRPLENLLIKYLLRAVVLFVFCGFGLCALFGLLMVLLFIRELLVKVCIVLLISVVLGVALTRTLRKRLKFVRKLRRLCKTYGFSLKYEQNFFQSLVWSPDRQDFVIKTKDRIYYVRYLTLNHYRSTLFLEKEDELRLVKYPLKNVFTLVFDVKPKEKIYPLKFDVPTPIDDVPTVKALIVNPVCEEIKYKSENGGYEQTGTGGKHFGFTVYTGSGFLETLGREA